MSEKQKEADELSALVMKRLELKSRTELQCPREKSFMTPCIARDGSLALTDWYCVGCGADVGELLGQEKAKHDG